MAASNETQPTYIDTMTQPFVDGFNAVDAQTLAAESVVMPRWIRPIFSQGNVKEKLASVDWENSGLTPQTVPGGAVLEPDAMAERLMTFAYDDAMTLLQASIGFLEGIGGYSNQTAQDVLHKSAKRMLMPAGLDDIHKNAVIRLLKARVLNDEAEAKTLKHHKHKAPDVQEPIHIDEVGMIAWHPDVYNWLVERAAALKGCPAHRKIVELNGQKMPLTHFMWHKFVDYAFAV